MVNRYSDVYIQNVLVPERYEKYTRTNVRKNNTVDAWLHLIAIRIGNVLTCSQESGIVDVTKAGDSLRRANRASTNQLGNILKELLCLCVTRAWKPTGAIDDSALEARSPFVTTESLDGRADV